MSWVACSWPPAILGRFIHTPPISHHSALGLLWLSSSFHHSMTLFSSRSPVTSRLPDPKPTFPGLIILALLAASSSVGHSHLPPYWVSLKPSFVFNPCTSLLQQIFIEHLPWASHCPRHWEYSSKKKQT